MIKIAVYSFHPFELPSLTISSNKDIELIYIEEALTADTVDKCIGCKGVAIFTSDDASASILETLHQQGIKFICTRSAGFDHIDLKKAKQLGISVSNVPAYSPHAIAEHSIALILALCRHLKEAQFKIASDDYSINDLVGFNLHYKTVGVIGTGRIGSVVCKILHGFGCHIVAYDVIQDQSLVDKYNLKYISAKELFAVSDIITLHAPLNESTQYLINQDSIAQMKEGVMIINTSRGKLICTSDLIAAIESGKVGSAGLDVYENEKGIFFHNFSETGIKDIMLNRLKEFDNVIITAHQAFLTNEALKNIADTTLKNIDLGISGQSNPNELT